MGHIEKAWIERGATFYVHSTPSGNDVEYYTVWADGVQIGTNTESGGSPTGMEKTWTIPAGTKVMCAVADNKVCVDVPAVNGNNGNGNGKDNTGGLLLLLGVIALGYILFMGGKK